MRQILNICDRGDFEEKLQNIISVLVAHPEVICFVDECHSLMQLGSSSEESGGGAANILKPYISRGELQFIMATTNEEYTKYIASDKAFARRFSNVLVHEPTTDELRKILVNILPDENKFFSRTIQEKLVDEVIELSGKYSLDLANPAKAINMLELACAYSKVFEENKQEVDIDDVIKSVKLKYSIYISNDKLADTKKELSKEILGQDKALNQVCRNLMMVDKGLCDPRKPLMSMMFVGPTGKLVAPLDSNI